MSRPAAVAALKEALDANIIDGNSALKPHVLAVCPSIIVKGGGGYSARGILNGRIIARSGSVRGCWQAVAEAILRGEVVA